MASSSGTILVVGATGRVGSAAVKILCQRGLPVRALCRSETRAPLLRSWGAEITLGDLGDPSSLTRACQGVHALIATATSLNPRRWRSPYRPEEIDYRGHGQLWEAARRASVEHIVYVSALGVDWPGAPRQFVVKRRVEESLRSSALPATILRPSGFMENLLPILRMIQRRGIAPLPGKGAAPITYIAAEDVARVAIDCLTAPPAGDRPLEFGGPQDVSHVEAVRIAAGISEKAVRIVYLPLPLLRVIGEIARPVAPALREFFAIAAFVDRYGLRAERRLPFPGQTWTPTSLSDFIRRHTFPSPRQRFL